MRRLVLNIMLTLDGYYAAPDGGLDWHRADAEHDAYANEQIMSGKTLVFGRKTYEGMAEFWTSEAAQSEDAGVTTGMNELEKFVFSRTLERADWQNTRLFRGDAVAEMARLKQDDGPDMVILGSGNLAQSLAQAGLIDEFQLLLNPVLIGDGLRLFEPNAHLQDLDLVHCKTRKSGLVELYYRPSLPV